MSDADNPPPGLSTELVQNAFLTQNVEQIQHRGRGRPRKLTVVKEKKPRGRPEKNQLTQEEKKYKYVKNMEHYARKLQNIDDEHKKTLKLIEDQKKETQKLHDYYKRKWEELNNL